MTRVELMEGFGDLLERTRDWSNFEARIKGFVSEVTRKPNLAPNTAIDNNVSMQKRIRKFLLSVDEDVRQTIFDILMHTRVRAPFLLERVFRLIIQQYNETVLLETLREEISQRIELEKSGKVKLETY